MQFQYLGTAAAEGWPAVFCRCKYCLEAQRLGGKNIRTRSQAIVNDDLLLDLPPDTYMHKLMNHLDLSRVKYLFVTHFHMDHFYPQELTVRGSVTPRTKTTEELYPVDAGGGLRLASTLCTFSYIREGQQVQSAIGCINTSNRPVRLELHPKESSGLLAADYPRELAPGQTAEINLMYLNPEGAPRYGSLRDALEVRADGRGNGTLIVAHGIGIDKSPADTRRTPKVQITENIIKFGPVKHNAPQQQRTFTLTNTGDGELIVRAVETGGKVATTLMPGQRIPAGSSFTAKATLDPGRQEYGVVTDFVTIITNDPTRPMRRLRATAIVED